MSMDKHICKEVLMFLNKLLIETKWIVALGVELAPKMDVCTEYDIHKYFIDVYACFGIPEFYLITISPYLTHYFASIMKKWT